MSLRLGQMTGVDLWANIHGMANLGDLDFNTSDGDVIVGRRSWDWRRRFSCWNCHVEAIGVPMEYECSS